MDPGAVVLALLVLVVAAVGVVFVLKPRPGKSPSGSPSPSASPPRSGSTLPPCQGQAPGAPRTDFRAAPLSFYTPDGRNDALFQGGKYGVRFAWIWSTPPAEGVELPTGLVKWQSSGTFDPKKNGHWPNNVAWSLVDVGVPPGPLRVKVGPYCYDLVIPSVGGPSKTDVLFIGDLNMHEDGNWGRPDVTSVMRKVVGNAADTSIIAFVGDILYDNTPFIRDKAWPALSTPDSGRPVTDFLVMGVVGNHDYDAAGCTECGSWTPKGQLQCLPTPPQHEEPPSAAWVPLYFATDGMKSFHDGLSDLNEPNCTLPLEYTTQLVVVGETAILTGDNTWKEDAVDTAVQDWGKVAAKLKGVVDTVIVATHWNSLGLGAVSTTVDWARHVGSKLPGFRVFGDTNHVHKNTAFSGGSPQVVTSGGNGFTGTCSDPKGSCKNNQCCCPSMWTKEKQWKMGGWQSGQVCGDLHGEVEAELVSELQTVPTDVVEAQLTAFNQNVIQTPSTPELLRWFAPPFVVDDSMFPSRKDPSKLVEGVLPIAAGSLPKEFFSSERMRELYRNTYGLDRGYPSCESLQGLAEATPGMNCWDDSVHPLDVFSVPKNAPATL